LRRGRLQLEGQLNRWTEAYLGGIIPLTEYQHHRTELEQRLASLDAQANLLVSQTDRQKELSGWTTSITDFCQRIQQSLVNATFEQKRQLVELLIDRVVVTGEEVEIRYVIPTSPDGEHTRFCPLRKDYFDHPAPRQEHEAFLRLGQLHPDQLQALILSGPGGLIASITLIHEGNLNRIPGG
jgi:site-specific DNA recombinase